MRSIHNIIILLCIFSSAYTQINIKEGIYRSFSDFKENKPLSLNSLSIPNGNSAREFLLAWDENNELIYFDKFGLQNILPLETIWGFYIDEIFYVKHGDTFWKLQLFGTISYFTAKVLIQREVPEMNAYTPLGQTRTKTEYSWEIFNYLLNLETGELLTSTPQHLELFIKDDTELLKEYMSLKNSKKNKLIFFFIRRYNREHPLLCE